MDWSKNVDKDNLKKVFQSDPQNRWKAWYESKSNQGHLKTHQASVNIPKFPKLGTTTDDSHKQVGNHNEVQIPTDRVQKRRIAEPIKPTGPILFKRTKPTISHPESPPDDSDFLPSSEFIGSKPGFIFKLSSLGLGYYADSAPKSISYEDISEKLRLEMVQTAAKALERYNANVTDRLLRSVKSTASKETERGLWKKKRDALTRKVVWVNSKTGEKRAKPL